ncbi:hypothetical protein [Parachryseolinea silvisoli]|uniref:hypothetical protein n=1 Tax=Parachryseolinea silvisoli TaxID=2873601 RepID=UPI002265BB46|nr:hypothetical protein [Parachryseolinea silvisoli]MCD9017209.1 hypothetical protein [Parachryseolinea silvisoli]
MKTLKATFLACLVLAAGACKDDDEKEAVSNDEAAEMIASSLAESSSGFAAVADESATVTDGVMDVYNGGRTTSCGYEYEQTFTRTNPSNASVTYEFVYTYHYLLSCENDAPKSMEVNVTYNGEFDGPRISSAHEGSADITITKLENTSATYSIDADYQWNGSSQSKIRNRNTTSSSVEITLDDVVVDKEAHEILSGSASATITGTVTGKGSFTYTGTIVFNGNHMAELTVKGIKYLVNLATGSVTAA